MYTRRNAHARATRRNQTDDRTGDYGFYSTGTTGGHSCVFLSFLSFGAVVLSCLLPAVPHSPTSSFQHLQEDLLPRSEGKPCLVILSWAFLSSCSYCAFPPVVSASFLVCQKRRNSATTRVMRRQPSTSVCLSSSRSASSLSLQTFLLSSPSCSNQNRAETQRIDELSKLLWPDSLLPCAEIGHPRGQDEEDLS